MAAAQVVTRRNRQTGTMITVCSAAEFGADPADPWLTVCEDHNQLVGHPTRRLANWHSADPAGWCSDCNNTLNINQGDIAP